MTDLLDGTLIWKSNVEATNYIIPKHEEHLIIDDGSILMMSPSSKTIFPCLSSKDIEQETIKTTEETGIDGIEMLPHPVMVPWRFDMQHKQTWNTKTSSRYVHLCDRGDNIYPKRGNLIRRGYSDGDIFNYWCNSCGYATTEEETTTLDFLDL